MAKNDLVFSKLPTGKDLDISDLEDSLNASRSTIRKLEASGRISRKHNGKKFIYDRKSVQVFMASFNRDDYYSISEANQVLKDHGICDEYNFFGSDSAKGNQCKYQRYTNEFPMSPTQLLARGYLGKDKDISPALITKKSMVDAIKKLKKISPSNNINSTSQPKSA